MLSNRNTNPLRNLGRHFRRRRKACHCKAGDCIGLDGLQSGREALVTCNNDIKTIERGLYHGKKVMSQRNVAGEPNIVVAVGDSRYVLDRRIARMIRVRLV
ncbi:MAG: ferrous iron transport protein A [Candidatus Cloacimonetes bacterium]|nr:ferrous iron transport protein A [Candidatus Cloacimonadota bacterium]